MLDEECRSIDNGIWLCDICARMIDDDKGTYDDVLLRRWRKEAEEYVAELVTQDTRLRQLRVMAIPLLSALRILSAVPGPGPVADQTFTDAGGIPLARHFIEVEQILFENDFVAEADIVQQIGHELVRAIHGRIFGHRSNECTDISLWKNEAVKRLMIDVLHFRPNAYARYLSVETKMVENHIKELKAREPRVIISTLLLPTEGLGKPSSHWTPAERRQF